MPNLQDSVALAADDDQTFVKRVEGAVNRAAWTVNQENIVKPGTPKNNQTQRTEWAMAALSNPRAMAKRMLPYVIAANSEKTADDVTKVSDDDLIADVVAAIDIFAGVVP